MIILGIDPGSVITGYGVITKQGRHCKLIECGAIRTKSGQALSDRLKQIYDGLCQVIDTHNPEQVAIESMFSGRYPKAALTLGHARGVALLAVANRDLPVSEYAPREVKMAVVGVEGTGAVYGACHTETASGP